MQAFFVFFLVYFVLLHRDLSQAHSIESTELALFAVTSNEKNASRKEYCPFKEACSDPSLAELERWDCLGLKLFDYNRTEYVDHDCSGVGWGNSIRGLIASAGLATVMGRSLVVSYSVFNRLFLPPHGPDTWPIEIGKHNFEKKHFDYEEYGRPPDRFKKFMKLLKKGQSPYASLRSLTGSVCGSEREMFMSPCVKDIIPNFAKCFQNARFGRIENLLAIPIFQYLFRRPAVEMAEKLAVIRERLSLPSLEPGQEPHPGSWGLRTPGHYIFAIHLRHIPIGFEPSAFEIKEHKEKRGHPDILDSYLSKIDKLLIQAKRIADCRGEVLLIYFATDNPTHLRPIFAARYSSMGKVIWGLTEVEVGHMLPSWGSQDERKLREYDEKLLEKSGTSSLESEIDSNGELKSSVLPISSLPVRVEKTEAAIHLHGTMSMVEWWILANSNWLVTHSGTSYSDTAAAVGLGPLGAMERLDFYENSEYTITSYRTDWNDFSCPVVSLTGKTLEQDRCLEFIIDK